MTDDLAAISTEPVVVTGEVVRTLTLNRPSSLNAITEELYTGLLAALDDVASDSGVRAVVITGTGRAFSAGGDMSLIRAMQSDPEVRKRTLETGRRIFQRFASLDVPVVAAVNGPAVGAGCTIALSCDVVFMTDHAYFADPHVTIGLVPGDGGVVLWPLLAGLPAARAYLLTGDRLPAADAFRLGVVHRIVSPEKLLGEAVAFGTRVAGLSATAVRETKQALNRYLAAAMSTAFDVAMQAEDRSFDSTEHRLLTADGRKRGAGERP